MSDALPRTESLTLQALSQLKRDIVLGEFQFGERLNIEILKKRYQMGGTPVREALNQLVAWTLVEALPLRGFSVASMTAEVVRSLFDSRLFVEERLLTSALQTSDAEWEAGCIAALHRIRRFLQSEAHSLVSNVGKWFELQEAFLTRVFQPAASICLWSFEERLLVQSMQYENWLLSRAGDLLEELEKQFQIYECFLDACLDKNHELAWSHYGAGIRRVSELINKEMA